MSSRLVSISTLWLAFAATACGQADDGPDMTTDPAVTTPGTGTALPGDTGTGAVGVPSTPGAQPITPPGSHAGATGGTGATGAGTGATGAGATGAGATGGMNPGTGATGAGATAGAGGGAGGGPTTMDPDTVEPGMMPTGMMPTTMPDPTMMPTGMEPEPEPAPEPEPEPTLITSGMGNFWQIGEVTEGGGNPTITVDENAEQQPWDGFGGTFNEAGWDALKSVSAAERERAIKLLFDKTEGAAFTYGRIPIGSSDYGLDRYSLQETEGGEFSIERDKQNLIPYIKAALAVKPDIKFWGSPWSPPPWMKDNNAFDRGNMDSAHFADHAEYLARFVEEYAKEGIIVEAIQPQNEPGWPQDYPSCQWSPQQMTTYIGQHLGPLFEQRLPDTEIWLGTMSNSAADKAPAIVSAVMGDATARAYVKGIGLQWGMEEQAANYSSSNWGVPVMQTEHKCGHYPWVENDTGPNGQSYPDGAALAPAPNDYAYAVESWGLIRSWITKGVNSYLAWNMILDTNGYNLDGNRPWAQNALIAVDRGPGTPGSPGGSTTPDSGTLVVTPTYYVFRHVAQYVEPGSVRINTNNDNALAWKNPDGSIVTVIHNSGGQTQMTLGVGGTTLQFDVPAQGWATVNWQPN